MIRFVVFGEKTKRQNKPQMNDLKKIVKVLVVSSSAEATHQMLPQLCFGGRKVATVGNFFPIGPPPTSTGCGLGTHSILR